MTARFLQLHTLTSYPASLLNRDDAGFAKRLPFGGASRIRISSQCLKRHWRTFAGEGSLQELAHDGGPMPFSLRSRRTFEREVYDPLVREGVPPELALAVTRGLMAEVLGEKAAKEGKAEAKGETKGDAKSAGETEDSGLRTGQVTVLGRPEVEYFLQEARAVCASVSDPKEAGKAVRERFKKDGKKNLDALRLGAGLDAALFGRMATSDVLARTDAAIHVAHAFTVDAEEAETDYFSAVDDLLAREDEESMGSGHIGTTELTTGFFYGYLVVDVPLLVANLEGCDAAAWREADRDLAARVVERLVRLVATVSPGAKLGSTAPHAFAHLVAAETGSAQPRTLANAFLDPVRRAGGGLVDGTYAALSEHWADLDAMYGRSTARRFAGLGPVASLAPALAPEERADLTALAAWAAAQVRSAE